MELQRKTALNMTFKESCCRHPSQGKAKCLRRWQTWLLHTHLWHVEFLFQLDICLGRAIVLKLPALRRKTNKSVEYVTQLVGRRDMRDFRHERHNKSSKLLHAPAPARASFFWLLCELVLSATPTSARNFSIVGELLFALLF